MNRDLQGHKRSVQYNGQDVIFNDIISERCRMWFSSFQRPNQKYDKNKMFYWDIFLTFFTMQRTESVFISNGIGNINCVVIVKYAANLLNVYICSKQYIQFNVPNFQIFLIIALLGLVVAITKVGPSLFRLTSIVKSTKFNAQKFFLILLQISDLAVQSHSLK